MYKSRISVASLNIPVYDGNLVKLSDITSQLEVDDLQLHLCLTSLETRGLSVRIHNHSGTRFVSTLLFGAMLKWFDSLGIKAASDAVEILCIHGIHNL